MELNTDSMQGPFATLLQWIFGLFGVILVGVGVWALGGAIYVAWGLFHGPDGIAQFADYFRETTQLAAQLQIGGEGLVHYVAWLAVILLLLVLGKLGAWAVTVGAQLLAALGRVR
jgi:hypothetical protein